MFRDGRHACCSVNCKLRLSLETCRLLMESRGQSHIKKVSFQWSERFEKLASPAAFRFRRIFLKKYNLKTAMDAGFECSRGPSAGPVSSEMLPEQAPDPEPRGYTATLDRIFMPLATLKAACRNQASNLFLMMVVNLARWARSCRWLMPKYCSTMYRILEMALLRRISDSVSLAVVEFLRMMPSPILLSNRKSRLGFPA